MLVLKLPFVVIHTVGIIDRILNNGDDNGRFHGLPITPIPGDMVIVGTIYGPSYDVSLPLKVQSKKLVK